MTGSVNEMFVLTIPIKLLFCAHSSMYFVSNDIQCFGYLEEAN